MRPSIEWANRLAADAPSISGEIPGPNSQALYDRAHHRHYGPYYDMINRLPVAFDHGDGVTLTDVDGNRYLDFTHGHMVAGLGHGHPAVVEAITRQARRLMNVREFPTAERVHLEERLREITPGDLNYFQFFNTGTEMTEAALRLARAATGGHEFVSFYGDYHGRTTSSAATSYGNRAGGPRPSGFITLPSGFCYRCEFEKTFPDCGIYCLDFMERAMQTNSHGALAGIIAEPITNGSGARVYPDGYLRKLRDIADRNNVLLIFDEHATGLGRTGKWFAADHEGVVPDALLLAKWLGNGFPITVLAIREKWKDALPRPSLFSTS
jgi:4-aminobutyrate aminotransferase-like enzyme